MERSFWCLKKPFWLQLTKHRCHSRQTIFYVGDFRVLPLFSKLWSYESYYGEGMKDKKQQQRDRRISVTCARVLVAIFSDHCKLNLWFKSKQDWELSRLRQVRMVKNPMGGSSLKTVLQPFPLPPHPLLIRGSQGLTCTQSSVVKLIIILLWKIRKSFCSKYQIPRNHMWQLLVYVYGGGVSVWKY